jgi:hypothetical protein
MVKILDLSEHMGLRIAGLLQGISRLHPGYIGLRAGPVTSLLHSLLEVILFYKRECQEKPHDRRAWPPPLMKMTLAGLLFPVI